MDSAPINGLIYQAVYITVFIVATTLTINLFTTINDYTTNVSKVVQLDSISEVVSENENIYDSIQSSDPNNANVTDLLKYEISGYEVFSLVNNYGMYTGISNYEYGKKYNGKVELDYKVKVYQNKTGNTLVTSINGINLLKKYNQNISLAEKIIEIRPVD